MANLPFIDVAKKHHIQYILGDEKDVLKRLVDCGRKSEATDVFRVTTESPYFYYEALADAWKHHVEKNNDVTTLDGVPEGSHFEIYSMKSLETSHRLGDIKHRSEFCSLYIREHRKDFKVQVLPIPAELERLKDLRLTVDYPEDLVVCRKVYAALREKAPRFALKEIISFLDRHPEVKSVVSSYIVPQRLWPEA